MRLLIFLLLLTCSLIARAGCVYVADYVGEVSGEKIGIDMSDGGCSFKEVMIEFWKINKNGSQHSYASYPFGKECFLTQKGVNIGKIKAYDGSYDGLYCRPNGHTPLAGATYKLVKFGRSQNSCADENELGNKFICIKGCGKLSVPEYINGTDGTC
jgi:hypothetical protein